MKNWLKAAGNEYEIYNEIPQATSMKNWLKAAGNEYEIYNEIPKLQEWKIHWKWQGIIMRSTMKSPSYKNEKFIESGRE